MSLWDRLRYRAPAIALVAVLVLPVLWWLKVAFVDSDTEMLPPSLCGRWVVHPEWQVVRAPSDSEETFAQQSFPPTVFRLDVERRTLDAAAQVEVTVMGSFRVRLGAATCAEFDETRGSWKRPVDVNLGSCLESASMAPNQEVVPLFVEAWNDDGPPPARVCWSEDAERAATGENGWSAWVPGRGWRPAAVAGREISELQGKDFEWPQGPWGYRVLLGLLSVLGLVGLLRAGPADEGQSGWAGESAGGRGDTASWIVLVLVAAVYLWNGLVYPWTVSRIDQGAHAERIREAAELQWLPPADRSFQSYQPPFYYALAGGLVALGHPGRDLTGSHDPEDLRPAQILDAAAGLGHVLLAFWLLRRYGPKSPRARALALAAVCLAPVAVTTYPMLGNETLSAALCGAALVTGTTWLARERPVAWAAAGGVAALALLTKYTAVMPVAAIGVCLAARVLAARPEERAVSRHVIRSGAIWAVVIAAVAGPFYVGRWLTWGSPFVGNWDPALGLAREGEPGYRTLSFFTHFGEVFFHAPERGMWSSFWDGLYASTWAEIFDSFVPVGDPAVETLQLLLMALAVVPTLAVIAGFALTVRRTWTRPPGLDLAMVAVSVFTLSSVAVFTTRVPFSSTVKALFLLSLLLPVALFAARGYARMEQGLGRARWLLDLVTVVQILLVLRLFLWRS